VASITPFLTAGRGYVRLELDFTTPASNSLEAKVWRLINGVATPIRDGAPALLSHSKAVLYDTEMPLDTPLNYRAFMPLNLDGGFEANVDGWDLTHNTENASGGGWSTVTRSTDYYVPGTGVASIKAMPVGTVTGLILVSEEVAVAAGTSLTAVGNMMVNKAYSAGIGLHIRWYTAAHGFVSTSGSADDLWPSPGEWGTYSITATAPATTAFARIGMVVAGTPDATMAFYADEMYASVAGSTVESTQVTFESGDTTGWWTDPLHPATMIRLWTDLRASSCGGSGVVFLNTGDRQRPADSSVLEVPDAERGAPIFATRKAVRSAVTVGALSVADADRISALHATGAPVLLQLPARYLETPRYGLYGDTADGRIATDMRVPIRALQASYVEVGPPIGPAEGVLGARYVDLDLFGTFAAATAASKTWIDALQGELSTLT
jgi:hypothetical protein